MGLKNRNGFGGKLAKKVEEDIKRAELTGEPIPDYTTDGPTAREELEMLKSGKFQGSFDYPGGIKQFEKDVESGMYDYRDD